jgi:hypothetical protein
MTEKPNETYDCSMLPGADAERYETEQNNKEIDKVIRDETMRTLVTTTSPDNLEILYALRCAAKHTNEKVTPARLIEMAGIYHSPDSTGYVTKHLEELREGAFVWRDGEAYKLTDCGEIIIGFWDRLSKCTVDFDILKDGMTPESKRLLERLPEKAMEKNKEIFRRIRRVDEHFQRGI